MRASKNAKRAMAVGALSAAVAGIALAPAQAVEGVTLQTFPHYGMCEEARQAWDGDPGVRYATCDKQSDSEFRLVVFFNE